MAFSKSFGATLFSPSMLLPSFRSNANAADSCDTDKRQRRSHWKRASLLTLRGRKGDADHVPAPAPAPTPAASDVASISINTSTRSSSSPTSASQLSDQDHDSQPTSATQSRSSLISHPQPAHMWEARTSSLEPAITPETTGPYPQHIQRKPVGLKMSPPQSPPPPYVVSEVVDDHDHDHDHGHDYEAGHETIEPIALDQAASTTHPASLQAEADSSALDVPVFSATLSPEPADYSAFPFSLATHPTPEIMVPDVPHLNSQFAPSPNQLPRLQTEPPREDIGLGDGEFPRRQRTLQKEYQTSRSRSSSNSTSKLTEPHLLRSRQTTPVPEHRGRRSVSAQVPLSSSSGSLAPNDLRSASSHDGSQSPARGKLRRSWLPGAGRSRSNSREIRSINKSEAWVLSDETQAEYNTSYLKNAEKVPELWTENGDIYVHLYPRGSGCGPSFKVADFVIRDSYVFNELIYGEEGGALSGWSSNFGDQDSPGGHDPASRNALPPGGPYSPEDPNVLRLYIPATPPSASVNLIAPNQNTQGELDRLIAIRNLFAFLTGQPLVATKTHHDAFHAFVEISKLLQEFSFSSPDGTNYGEAVELSFGFYLEQLGLSDCRHSHQKTIEALILGERMRCVELYNEAFAHAAGKYSSILDSRLPLLEAVSPTTRQRLERSHLDLLSRQKNVNEHLEQFDFPSLFSGIANSTSIPELRQVRFKVWRNSFGRMRHFLLGYYKTIFGSWPPKASSKKNPFAESGLNRLVLKVLYSDMCALYDLLVDRTNLTSRVMDEVPAISDEPSKMIMSALRNLLSEFDRSRPPVLPPIPFDLPQIPRMTAIYKNFDSMPVREKIKMEKRMRENELMLILNKAYNYDTSCISLPFLDEFRKFEIREGRGKPCQDLADQRIGYWIFLYAVLQSLPMLVIDAPGVKHTGGVEYFLCQPPMGNLPWMEDGQIRKMWYEVASGGGLVELSADAVMFSVEATYHRSHCWLAAKQWEVLEEADDEPSLVEERPMSPLEPPAPIFPDDGLLMNTPPASNSSSPVLTPSGAGFPAPIPRNLSPASRARRYPRSSIAIGLEPVPLEPPNAFGSHHRSSSYGPRPGSSSHMGFRSSSAGNLAGLMSRASSPVSAKPCATSSATFDDILGKPAQQPALPAAKKNPTIVKKRSRFF